MKQINQEKGLYDKIYRIEEIYRMFPEEERCEIALITEPVRLFSYFLLSLSIYLNIINKLLF